MSGRYCPAVLAFLAAIAIAAPADERLARGEVVVTRLPAGERGTLGGRSQGVVRAPIERVWTVLNESNEFENYMPNFRASWLIDRLVQPEVACRGDWQRGDLERLIAGHRLADWPGDTVLFYNVLDMPFPVSDRWYLLEMWRDRELHTIGWSQLVGNLRTTHGSWELSPWAAGQTLATYTTVSNPGISLPRFFLDIGLNQSLPGVIRGLRNRVMAQEPGK
jgi:hypothetical protein